ncbi:hypothetical protein [Lacimonas salitolerans]|uniref:Uncharacterized protein n=1 Tax=Lacimonas salitolerans TaxID=1323750 RepID=A0ABW4EE87_9RHOB
MQDIEQTTANAVNEEKKARRKIARKIALAFWTAEFKKSNPEADDATIKAAWGDARREKTKAALVAMRRLEKNGVVIAPAQTEAKAA